MLPRVNLVRTDQTDYLLFSTNDAITTTIQANGYWAKPLIDISIAFCAGIEKPLVLDVGANLGSFSIPLAQNIASQGGVVYSYEPQRIIFYQLCGNVFLNRLENVCAFNYAVGSASGKIDIPDLNYYNCRNIGGFTMSELAKTIFQIESAGGSNLVDIVTIDQLILPKEPDLIKIDVEGFELEVLNGAKARLEAGNFPPMLLEAATQWHVEQRNMVLNCLQQYGYSYFAISDEIIAQHPAHSRQFDFSIGENSMINMVRVR